MASDNSHEQLDILQLPESDSFDASILAVLRHLATRLEHIDEKLDRLAKCAAPQQPIREYYSIAEFAELVGKRQYTVREWCRLHRINAEKCETGRGDAKTWKISNEELQRYRNHGLLPATYLR